MWLVCVAWFHKGVIFSSAQWVVCMMMPLDIMTWGTCIIGCLFLHRVFTLI